MISDNDYILIEQYLRGRLSGIELDNFQQRQKNDIEFSEEVILKADILKGIKATGRKELKSQIISLSLNGNVNKTRKVHFMRLVGIAASILFIVGLGFWFVWKQNGRPNNTLAQDINNQAIALTSVNIPSEYKTIDNSRTTQFNLKSNQHISIPAGAFLDEQGKPVKEKIKINCKSLNSLFDQFIAGIPTAFDSANQVKLLHAETMLDISAFASLRLKVNPSKPLQIIIPTNDSLQSNQIYKLDTIKKCWLVCGSDMFINLNKYSRKILPDILIPRLEDRSKRRFKISVNEKQFPELAEYKNYIFEIAPRVKNYDTTDEQQIWKSIVVKKGTTPGEPYLVTLKNDIKTVTYPALPVFAKEYYAQAMKIYNEKISNSFQHDELKKYELAQYIAKNIQGKNRHANYRVFTITSPGIYSDSKLIGLKDSSAFNCSFTDQQGNSLALAQIAIVDFSQGVIRRLKAGENVKLLLDNATGKALLAITTNKQLAYLRATEFRNVFSNSNASIVKLNITEISNSNYQKIKTLFNKQELGLVLNFINHK